MSLTQLYSLSLANELILPLLEFINLQLISIKRNVFLIFILTYIVRHGANGNSSCYSGNTAHHHY